MRICIAILCSATAVWGAGAPAPRIRDAATRAVALIQASQKGWYARQSCNSCHHQYQPSLAYQSAREHGIPVNEAIAHNDAVRAFADTDLDRAIQYNYVIEPAMDDAYRLVAAHAAGLRPNLITAVYARLLASRQNPDGSWDSFHQRPPASYSRFTETALVLRAVQLYSHPSLRADASLKIERARKWLLAHSPRDNEERTYQLLGLFWAGSNRTGSGRSALEKAARTLLATQQPDGGWSSLDGRPSDAYSTGQALVALHDAGNIPISNPDWQRGIGFLLNTQAADGSWHVISRLHPPAPVSPPYFETGYPYGHDQFISAAGASWAVMALGRALGPANHLDSAPLLAPRPIPAEPWMETVLFGTEADLTRLLDTGFDANSATAGGTTALMMAAPSAAKMKLLLDHGAKVNARAKTKYSALMVAAQYRDSTAAIRLLLAHGAEVRPAPGQGAPLFNANPLFLAAYAGNAEILRELRNAGGDLEAPVLLIGTSSTTPMAGAVRFGNLEVARALFDLGASIDRPDGSGITPLDRAVLGNQVEMARWLIERGADVNHLDKLGMTPLLYAASIDFGDSQIIDLLLNSGARENARTRDGLTALDLARNYQHIHLLASLQRARPNAASAAATKGLAAP